MGEEERKGGGGGEEEAAAAAARVAEQARELQDAAAALLTRTRAEEDALHRRAAALQGELRRLRKAAAHADSDKVRLLTRAPAIHLSLCVRVRVRACLPSPPLRECACRRVERLEGIARGGAPRVFARCSLGSACRVGGLWVAPDRRGDLLVWSCDSAICNSASSHGANALWSLDAWQGASESLDS